MRDKSQSGFSYIDVMIAIVIMMVGILGLLAAITSAMIRSKGQEQQLAAKQIVASTMESIMSAKETDQERPVALIRLGWPAIGNEGTNFDPATGTFQGIFLNGIQSVRTDAGPDEIVGTADDTGPIVPGFTRQIVITDVCDPDRPSPNCPTPGTLPVKIRTVQVTVTYFVGALTYQETANNILTDYTVVTN